MVSSRALWVLWACGPALAFRGSPRVLPRLPGQKWHVAAAPAEASGGAAASAAVPLVEGLGVGVKADVAGRLPFYRSDVVDGLSVKSVSVVLYLFFACLAPAVAFGSLQGTVTGGQIGAVEYILSTAACGVVYALTAAQPLTIIGSTGPVLAFTTVLFKLAASLGVPFLPLYAWTGLWASLYLFLGALFSLSNGVKYLTRFTDEIFSSLISTIFVYEAAKDVIFGALLNPKMAASTAFATALSAATTYGVATYNAGLRGAKKLKRSLRSGLADFAPAIGILSGCLAGVWAGHRAGAPLATLAMPKVFGTTSGRPWLVNLMDLPPKYRALSALPAAMVAVLLFFDQNITVRIVNADQNKLKKPTGYHQDLLVVSLLAAACSATGLPWLVAATVRSINHVNANAVYEEQDAADDGDAALAFAGVKEQRVTALAIHATIGAALLFGRDVLAKTPQAALMGLFLYLGTSALKGNQMFARSTELLGAPFIDLNHLDDKLAASRPWAKLPKAKTRAFTAIQLACLAAMMTLKSSPAGVLFPIIIAGLGPLRWVMLKTKAFTQAEIDALDMD